MQSGGTTNQISDLRMTGHVSTGELSKILGVQVSRGLIEQELQILPAFVLRKGAGVYWHKDQIPPIAIGIAKNLIELAKSLQTGKASITRF